MSVKIKLWFQKWWWKYMKDHFNSICWYKHYNINFIKFKIKKQRELWKKKFTNQC